MISPAILAAKPAGGAPPSYVGPLDLVPGAVVAYSQRAMAAAWVSNAITIRRDSDDATQSFATTTNNAVDAAAVIAFLGGANGFVTEWKDQSGNGYDVSQASTPKQPSWGNSPSKLLFNAPDETKLVTSGNVSFEGAETTIFAVLTRDTVGAIFGVNYYDEAPYSGLSCHFDPSIGNTYLDVFSDNYDAKAGGSGTPVIFPDDTLLLVEFSATNGIFDMVVNGVGGITSDQWASGIVGLIDGNSLVVGDDNMLTDNPVSGGIIELPFYPINMTPSDRAAVRSNIANRYGIPLHGGEIISLSVRGGGSGWSVDDQFTLNGGGPVAQGRVTSVDGGGAVTDVEISVNSPCYVSWWGNNCAAISPATGTDLFVDVVASDYVVVVTLNDNSLTSLDVSANTALVYLSCANNSLTSLGLGANTALVSLSCTNNSLTSLDVSGATALTSLLCADNSLIEASIDAVLASLDAAGNNNGVANLAGGSNASPSAAGLISKANLEIRGWTVSVN